MEQSFRVFILKIVISPALGRERQDQGASKPSLHREQPPAALGTATRAPRSSVPMLYLWSPLEPCASKQHRR
jgi:hypothetical protein